MSVDCRIVVGLTLEFPGAVDFEKVEAFTEKHPELDEYKYRFDEREGKLLLIGDGMNGDFLRLVKVDKIIDELEDFDFVPLNMPSGVLSQELISQMSLTWLKVFIVSSSLGISVNPVIDTLFHFPLKDASFIHIRETVLESYAVSVKSIYIRIHLLNKLSELIPKVLILRKAVKSVLHILWPFDLPAKIFVMYYHLKFLLKL